MRFDQSPAKCQVPRKVTKRGVVLCCKPAPVVILLHTPEPLVMCVEHSRKLRQEIGNSLEGAL
jgi:hypothetical protein